MLKLFFCFCLSFIPAAGLHPLHVSVTEINFDEKERTLEIMMRIFIDDLETTMRKRHGIHDLDILNPKGKTIDDLMKEYLAAAFQISLDGKQQSLNYLGNEKDGDVFIFYVEVSKVRKWKTISVTNSVLTEVFDDQSNLVHVTSGDIVRSLRLNESNPTGVITFQQ